MRGDFKQANENNIDNKWILIYIGQSIIVIEISKSWKEMAGGPKCIGTNSFSNHFNAVQHMSADTTMEGGCNDSSS